MGHRLQPRVNSYGQRSWPPFSRINTLPALSAYFISYLRHLDMSENQEIVTLLPSHCRKAIKCPQSCRYQLTSAESKLIITADFLHQDALSILRRILILEMRKTEDLGILQLGEAAELEQLYRQDAIQSYLCAVGDRNTRQLLYEEYMKLAEQGEHCFKSYPMHKLLALPWTQSPLSSGSNLTVPLRLQGPLKVWTPRKMRRGILE